MISFNFNYLHKDLISKYSYSGTWGFNTGIWREHKYSVYNPEDGRWGGGRKVTVSRGSSNCKGPGAGREGMMVWLERQKWQVKEEGLG